MCITDTSGQCSVDVLEYTDYYLTISKTGYVCVAGCGTFNSGLGGTIYATLRASGCTATFLPSKTMMFLTRNNELVLSGTVVNLDDTNSKEIGVRFTRPDSVEVIKSVGVLSPCQKKDYTYTFGKIYTEIYGKWFLEQVVKNTIWATTEVAFVQVQEPEKLVVDIPIVLEPNYPLIAATVGGVGVGLVLLAKQISKWRK